jgi:hypothetical protein
MIETLQMIIYSLKLNVPESARENSFPPTFS